MSPNVEEQLDSSSLWNLLYYYCNQLYYVLFSNFSITSNFNSTRFSAFIDNTESPFKVIPYLKYLASLFPYDEFQLELLKIFCAIILANTCLLVIAWKIYGKHICQRFMKPGKNYCRLLKLYIFNECCVLCYKLHDNIFNFYIFILTHRSQCEILSIYNWKSEIEFLATSCRLDHLKGWFGFR